MKNTLSIAGALLLSACITAYAQQATSGNRMPASGTPAAHPTPQLQATGPGERNAPPARGPNMEVSLELAKKIEAICAIDGFHVGISIIDSAGLPKLYYVTDGAGGQHANQAFRKATTALKFNMDSSKVADARKNDPQLAALWDANPTSFAGTGGLLLKVGNEVIGAVGVSGAAPSTKDEECALAAVKDIQPILK